MKLGIIHFWKYRIYYLGLNSFILGFLLGLATCPAISPLTPKDISLVAYWKRVVCCLAHVAIGLQKSVLENRLFHRQDLTSLNWFHWII